MIVFSKIVGFGLTSLFGVPLSNLSLVLIFIVVGVGVDDVMVLVDFLERAKTTSQRRDSSSLWFLLCGAPFRCSRFALGLGAVVMIVFSESRHRCPPTSERSTQCCGCTDGWRLTERPK